MLFTRLMLGLLLPPLALCCSSEVGVAGLVSNASASLNAYAGASENRDERRRIPIRVSGDGSFFLRISRGPTLELLTLESAYSSVTLATPREGVVNLGLIDRWTSLDAKNSTITEGTPLHLFKTHVQELTSWIDPRLSVISSSLSAVDIDGRILWTSKNFANHSLAETVISELPFRWVLVVTGDAACSASTECRVSARSETAVLPPQTQQIPFEICNAASGPACLGDFERTGVVLRLGSPKYVRKVLIEGVDAQSKLTVESRTEDGRLVTIGPPTLPDGDYFGTDIHSPEKVDTVQIKGLLEFRKIWLLP